MNQGAESSNSNPPSSPHMNIACSAPLAQKLATLLNAEGKYMRKQVKFVQNLNTVTYFSTVLLTAFQAIDSIINQLTTKNLFPNVEDTDSLSFEPSAYQHFFDKSCDINKEITKMFTNAISTISPPNNEITTVKMQCDESMGKIEFLMESTFLRDFYSHFDEFALFTSFRVAVGIFDGVCNILKLKESGNDVHLINRIEGVFGCFEMICRNSLSLYLGDCLERIKNRSDSNLKRPIKPEEIFNCLPDNLGIEASTSSSSLYSHMEIACKVPLTEKVNFLLKGRCKQLREEVESVNNMDTLAFFYRAIGTTFHAIHALICKLSTQFWFRTEYAEHTDILSSEPFAYKNFSKKACDIVAQITAMISNVIIWTSSIPNYNTGGNLEEVLMLKKHCDENIGKIEFLIKSTFLRDFRTSFDEFALNGTFNGVYGVLDGLCRIFSFKQSVGDEQFRNISLVVFRNFNVRYKEETSALLEVVFERLEEDKLLEEAISKRSQDKEPDL